MLSFIVVRLFRGARPVLEREVQVSRRTLHGFAWLAGAFLLAALVLTSAPHTAIAAPSSSIAAKQAERDRTLAELDEMRQSLSAQTKQYVGLCQRLDRTRAEVATVATEIVQMDVELREAEEAFTQRTIQMYRRDRSGMLELLLSSRDVEDFMKRTYYLVVIGNNDAQVITRVRQARAESMWLQQSLSNRVVELQRLQTSADDARTRIESEIDEAEEKAASIGQAIATLVAAESVQTFTGGSDPGGAFTPNLVISEPVFRNTAPMTVAEIQAFLDAQPGMLDTHKAKDHAGKIKSTAEMIFDASTAFNISAKVILVKLQKEQSLLADNSPTTTQLDWAMGCGKADSRTYYQYQGFGQQIWWGAQKLDKNSRPWQPGISLSIDGTGINPANSATYSLYKYTPHFRGTQSFWMLYWRYFGNPL